MKVICINNSNRPPEIPLEKWIKEGNPYTVTKVMKLNIQNLIGYELEEIDLTPYAPVLYFDSRRFAVCAEPQSLEEQEVLQAA